MLVYEDPMCRTLADSYRTFLTGDRSIVQLARWLDGGDSFSRTTVSINIPISGYNSQDPCQ